MTDPNVLKAFIGEAVGQAVLEGAQAITQLNQTNSVVSELERQLAERERRIQVQADEIAQLKQALGRDAGDGDYDDAE